jgi:tetratricopeptide (TPR) repeat protein
MDDDHPACPLRTAQQPVIVKCAGATLPPPARAMKKHWAELGKCAMLDRWLASITVSLWRKRDTSEFATYFSLLTTARTIYEAEERVSGEPQRDLAAVENDIGMALMGVGRLDEAEQQFEVALMRYGAMGAAGESPKSHTFISLAQLRLRQGRLDDALVLIDQAADLAERHGNMSALGSAYLVRADFHEQRGEPDQAIEWLRKGVRAAAGSAVDPSKLLGTALPDETAQSADTVTGA